MKLARKIEIAQQAVRSISRHDDAEADVVNAALDRVVAFIAEERGAADRRRKAKREEAVRALSKVN